MSTYESLVGITVKRPDMDEWKAWTSTLKTGDVVLVCEYPSNRSIYKVDVRVTPTGKVYLNDRHSRDRKDWAKNMVTSTPGGGDRFIVPLPVPLGGGK